LRGHRRGHARLAATRGWDLCLAYRSDSDAAEAVALECIEAGVERLAVQADVATR